MPCSVELRTWLRRQNASVLAAGARHGHCVHHVSQREGGEPSNPFYAVIVQTGATQRHFRGFFPPVLLAGWSDLRTHYGTLHAGYSSPGLKCDAGPKRVQIVLYTIKKLHTVRNLRQGLDHLKTQISKVFYFSKAVSQHRKSTLSDQLLFLYL